MNFAGKLNMVKIRKTKVILLGWFTRSKTLLGFQRAGLRLMKKTNVTVISIPLVELAKL